MHSQIEGWYKIWYQPKSVMHYVTENKTKLSLFFLILLYGVSIDLAFKLPQILYSVSMFGVTGRLIFVELIGGAVGGLVGVALTTILIYVVGPLFRVSMDFKKVLSIHVWSLVPFTLFIATLILSSLSHTAFFS